MSLHVAIPRGPGRQAHQVSLIHGHDPTSWSKLPWLFVLLQLFRVGFTRVTSARAFIYS